MEASLNTTCVGKPRSKAGTPLETLSNLSLVLTRLARAVPCPELAPQAGDAHGHGPHRHRPRPSRLARANPNDISCGRARRLGGVGGGGKRMRGWRRDVEGMEGGTADREREGEQERIRVCC